MRAVQRVWRGNGGEDVEDINVRTTILTELDHADSQKEQN